MGDRPGPDPAGFGDLPSVFFALAHEVKRLANARYQGSGLSMARLMVLHELVDRGPIRIGSLSTCLNVAARTMTSTVDGLVREGLVERQTDPTDGRAVVVSLTVRGRRQYERGVEVRDGVLAEVFDVLDDRERDQLASVLHRLGTAAREVAARDAAHESGPGAGGASHVAGGEVASAGRR